jgi:hypothetical protein
MGAVVPTRTGVDLLTDYQAHKIGASFGNVVNAGASLQTYILPAANVNGVILRTGWLTTTANNMLLVADTAAPSSPTDTTKRAIASIGGAAAFWALGQQLYLPPGYGLYLYTDGGTNRGNLTWDVLP